jgi:hypothetical protein
VLDYELEAAWPENAAWPRSRLRTISDSKLVVVQFELRRRRWLISAQLNLTPQAFANFSPVEFNAAGVG